MNALEARQIAVDSPEGMSQTVSEFLAMAYDLIANRARSRKFNVAFNVSDPKVGIELTDEEISKVTGALEMNKYTVYRNPKAGTITVSW